MNTKKKLMTFTLLGALAAFAGCDSPTEEPAPSACGNGICDSNETTASCAMDCPVDTSICDSDGTCDGEETFDNCPADCNSLCTGADDLAYREGLVGDGMNAGAWDDVDCAGLAQNEACVGAGMTGANVACGAAQSESECNSTSAASCTWGGDGTGCIGTDVAMCANAGAGGEGACSSAGCVFSSGTCVPAQSETNCTAGSSVLMQSRGFSCQWSADRNSCWFPKTGLEKASVDASDCGLACLTNADPVNCTIACMLGADKLGPDALSSGCMSCYSSALDCTKQKCILPCSLISGSCNNQCSEACITALNECSNCRTTQGCDAIFDACSVGS